MSLLNIALRRRRSNPFLRHSPSTAWRRQLNQSLDQTWVFLNLRQILCRPSLLQVQLSRHLLSHLFWLSLVYLLLSLLIHLSCPPSSHRFCFLLIHLCCPPLIHLFCPHLIHLFCLPLICLLRHPLIHL